MKTDINGCSTCQVGCENYESYTQTLGRRVYNLVQYDYRHTDGELFTTVAPSLEEARRRRDKWLAGKANNGK